MWIWGSPKTGVGPHYKDSRILGSTSGSPYLGKATVCAATMKIAVTCVGLLRSVFSLQVVGLLRGTRAQQWLMEVLLRPKSGKCIPLFLPDDSVLLDTWGSF